MNGAELLVDTLAQAGVRRIFSLSGNQIMPIYDACIDTGISIVHVRHESAAVHMADAWAQVTGEIGVALVTAGPGFGNALSALFSARHSESTVLLLSGDSPVGADGNGAFQELAQVDVARPLVKTSRRPVRVEQLAHGHRRRHRLRAIGTVGDPCTSRCRSTCSTRMPAMRAGPGRRSSNAARGRSRVRSPPTSLAGSIERNGLSSSPVRA